MVSWLFLTSVACDHAYHVKAVPALADDNRTVVARELAFATGAFEVYTADTACVVGLFGQIPFQVATARKELMVTFMVVTV